MVFKSKDLLEITSSVKLQNITYICKNTNFISINELYE